MNNLVKIQVCDRLARVMEESRLNPGVTKGGKDGCNEFYTDGSS
jgi:hypothetical protein